MKSATNEKSKKDEEGKQNLIELAKITRCNIAVSSLSTTTKTITLKRNERWKWKKSGDCVFSVTHSNLNTSTHSNPLIITSVINTHHHPPQAIEKTPNDHHHKSNKGDDHFTEEESDLSSKDDEECENKRVRKKGKLQRNSLPPTELASDDASAENIDVLKSSSIKYRELFERATTTRTKEEAMMQHQYVRACCRCRMRICSTRNRFNPLLKLILMFLSSVICSQQQLNLGFHIVSARSSSSSISSQTQNHQAQSKPINQYINTFTHHNQPQQQQHQSRANFFPIPNIQLRQHQAINLERHQAQQFGQRNSRHFSFNNNNNNNINDKNRHNLHNHSRNRHIKHQPVADRRASGGSSGSPTATASNAKDDGQKLLVCYYTTRQAAPYWPKDAREYVMTPDGGLSPAASMQDFASEPQATFGVAPLTIMQYEPYARNQVDSNSQDITIGNGAPQEVLEFGGNNINVKNQQQQLVFKSAAMLQAAVTANNVPAVIHVPANALPSSVVMPNNQPAHPQTSGTGSSSNNNNNNGRTTSTTTNKQQQQQINQQQQQHNLLLDPISQLLAIENNQQASKQFHANQAGTNPPPSTYQQMLQHQQQPKQMLLIGGSGDSADGSMVISSNDNTNTPTSRSNKQTLPIYNFIGETSNTNYNGGLIVANSNNNNNNNNNMGLQHNEDNGNANYIISGANNKDNNNNNNNGNHNQERTNSMRQQQQQSQPAQQLVFAPTSTSSRSFNVGGGGGSSNNKNEILDTKSQLFISSGAVSFRATASLQQTTPALNSVLTPSQTPSHSHETALAPAQSQMQLQPLSKPKSSLSGSEQHLSAISSPSSLNQQQQQLPQPQQQLQFSSPISSSSSSSSSSSVVVPLTMSSSPASSSLIQAIPGSSVSSSPTPYQRNQLQPQQIVFSPLAASQLIVGQKSATSSTAAASSSSPMANNNNLSNNNNNNNHNLKLGYTQLSPIESGKGGGRSGGGAFSPQPGASMLQSPLVMSPSSSVVLASPSTVTGVVDAAAAISQSHLLASPSSHHHIIAPVSGSSDATATASAASPTAIQSSSSTSHQDPSGTDNGGLSFSFPSSSSPSSSSSSSLHSPSSSLSTTKSGSTGGTTSTTTTTSTATGGGGLTAAGSSLSSALVSSPLSTMFDVFGAASHYLMRFKPSSLLSPAALSFNTISSSDLHHPHNNNRHYHHHLATNQPHHHHHHQQQQQQLRQQLKLDNGGSHSPFASLIPSALSFGSGKSSPSPGASATSTTTTALANDRSGGPSISLPASPVPILSRFSLQHTQRREDVCGRTIQTPERRIIGGEGARYGEFPYQVHIKIAKHQCGGALVDRQSIVTAAHCVYHFITRAPVSKLQIVIGAYDIEDEQYQELPPQYFKVNKVKLHPNFRFSASHPDRYDVAILKLDKPVKYTDNVLPVCLPSKDLKFESQVATVTGFGKTDPSLSNRYGTRLLQKVDVPIIENNECERWHRTRGIDLKIFPEMMCAGYEDGLKDACVGDSGGPLVVKTSTGPNGAFRWTLAGITSAGFGCAQSRQPGIYHRVSHTVDWILQNLD